MGIALHKPKIYLASGSPRRREILASAGFRFQVVATSEVEERTQGKPGPLARWNARAKCRSAEFPESSPGALLGADTVVAVDDMVLGKPQDREDARSMLERLSGRWHRVISALCLRTQLGQETLVTTTTRVHIRPLAESWLRDYLLTGEADDKAGAYGIQGRMAQQVDKVSGCYFNVVGLSPASVRFGLEKLQESGEDYLVWPGEC
jgi:septum formation protein